MKYTHFTLLRHGLPKKADCLLGRTNPPLTTKGWVQMEQSCSDLTFDLMISSPLDRCQTYAKYLALQHKCELKIVNDWQELDFGDWDGHPIAELWADPQQAYGKYWHAPFESTPPNGESTNDFIHRLTTSINHLSREHCGKRILIVCHSGVMRMVLAWLLDSVDKGNPHLSRVQLEHAAVMKFNTYIDSDDRLWPQLQSLSNPSLNLKPQADK